ncbi:hypothetical protein B0F90DRAFT_1638326 [Multifurca ochricompacta]|uniref:Tubulin-specific chaperone A n=1 Tax=Multifurca ochricompacta TaxID=376703 RepID=A0AAD4LYA9_9AGAM|nr:hypothetical protein B0F90DRAFT_1638326 [Multifurca ochricompacta]
MSDTAATRRQLKIKAGVVKRLIPEGTRALSHRSRGKQNKLESLIASGADIESWEAKNATSLIRESENMVHDTTTRLERAAGELKDLVVRIIGSSFDSPCPLTPPPLLPLPIHNFLGFRKEKSRIGTGSRIE